MADESLSRDSFPGVNPIDSPVNSQEPSSSRTAAALALVEDAICIIDWEQRIRYLNPAMAKTFGLNADVAVDQPWDQAIRTEDESQHRQLAACVLAALDGQPSHGRLRLSVPRGDATACLEARVHALATIPPEALLVVREAAEERHAAGDLESHLHNLERVGSIIAQAEELDAAMQEVLELVRTSFDADRAWLIHPCDPEAASFRVPYEATRPGFPGLAADGGRREMSAEIADILRDALAAPGPLLHPDVSRFGSETHRKYRVLSQMLLVLRPRGSPPWLLGLHDCTRTRAWSKRDSDLFFSIGERLTSALAQQTLHRRLREDIGHRQEIERALLRTLADHRRLIDAIPDAVFTLDPAGRLMRWNAAVERITGRPPERLRGRPAADLFPAGESGEITARLAECLSNGSAETETHLIASAGESLLFHWILVALLDEQGRPTGITAVGRDITQRRHTQAHLRRTAAVFEDALECFLMMDGEFRIQVANRAFLSMTGWSSEAVRDRSLFDIGWLADAAAPRHIRETLQATGHWQGELWTRGTTRAFCRISINAVYDSAGELDGYVLVSTDITELRQTQDQLRHLAHHDPLTGLANRVLFGSMLEEAIEEAEQSGERFALFYIDLDGFKQVNDQLGHQTGDRLLAAIGKRLAQVVREKRSTARLGGDEFTLLLRRIEETTAVEIVARRVLNTLGSPISLAERQIELTASIGIALFPLHGRTADALMHAADQAMYAAKSNPERRYSIAELREE